MMICNNFDLDKARIRNFDDIQVWLSRNSIALVAFNFAPIIIIMINGKRNFDDIQVKELHRLHSTVKSLNPPLLVKFITYYLDVTLL